MRPFATVLVGSGVTLFGLFALGAQIGGVRGYVVAACAAALYAVIVGALLQLPWRGTLILALGALPLGIVFVALAHEPQPLRAVLTGLLGGWYGYCLLRALRSGTS